MTDLKSAHCIYCSVFQHKSWLTPVVEGPVAGAVTVDDLPCIIQM